MCIIYWPKSGIELATSGQKTSTTSAMPPMHKDFTWCTLKFWSSNSHNFSCKVISFWVMESWLIREDRFLILTSRKERDSGGATSTPSSKSLIYKKEKKTSSSPIMWHRYAKRTIGWLCPFFTRCKKVQGQLSDRGIDGEHWAQCARVRR